jgi:hypothetical protein
VASGGDRRRLRSRVRRREQRSSTRASGTGDRHDDNFSREVPLFERYGNNPALEGVRVAKFPADDDKILVNAPYADNFVIMYMYQGKVTPA